MTATSGQGGSAPGHARPATRPPPADGTFWWPVRVYYEDTDAGGVVYYANYLRYFERARTEFLRALGFELDALRERLGIVFVVRRVQADYREPARFNDQLLIASRLDEVRRASLGFQQEIVRCGAQRRPLCRARIEIVCVDAGRWRPTGIPKLILQRLQS